MMMQMIIVIKTIMIMVIMDISKYLSLDEWQEIFSIDPLSIVDEMEWNPYALNEGLVDRSTKVSLSLVQVSRLSKLVSYEIEKLWNSL